MLHRPIDQLIHRYIGFHKASLRLRIDIQNMVETARINRLACVSDLILCGVCGAMENPEGFFVLVECQEARRDLHYCFLVFLHSDLESVFPQP